MAQQREHPVSDNGVSIDLLKIAREARQNVDRSDDGVPIHACGVASHRFCPCGKCLEKNCTACIAAS